MPDNYEPIRSLPFPTIAGLLGLDLKSYKTRKAGREWYGACPVHNPQKNTTSFSFNADGRFLCFSCGAKGRGAIDLVKLVKNVGFQEAVGLLSTPYAPAPSQAIEATTKSAPSSSTNRPSGNEVLKPYTGSYEKFKVECEWLTKRIPDKEVLERYGVFCYNNPARKSAYSGRVMLPIKDIHGILYGYLGRYVGDESAQDSPPKYLFPKGLEKSRFLFGAHELVSDTSRQLPLKLCYLVESPFSVMKFASLGLPAVSPFGWSVSDEQIQILKGIARGVVYLPDSNKRKESEQLVPRLAQSVWLRFPPLPDGIDDPEAMTLEQIQAL